MSTNEGRLDLPLVGTSPGIPARVEIFDTTLRDGAQFEGISMSVDDKLRVAEQLDYLGVHWIEGGYPLSNPRDQEFFRRAPLELNLATARMVAFGSTRRPAGKVDADPTLLALVEAKTDTVCIVGKSWDVHVERALGTTLDEGVAMVGDSVQFLSGAGLRVFFDAEHFFDGYKANTEYALRVLEAAATAGVDCLVLCDTNGGCLPHEVQRITSEVVSYFEGVQIGIHTQNDTGCAVGNALGAVVAGATQVQGTINGYGERTGNADLITTIPNLSLKMGVETIAADRIERLTEVSRAVADIVNLPPNPAAPYVGRSAFAHKAGLHTSALKRMGSSSYEHVSPEVVGNSSRVLVSDLGGRAGLGMKAAAFGLDLDGEAATRLMDELKTLESQGWSFEAADGTLELLMRRAMGWHQDFFRIESYRVTSYHRAARAGEGTPFEEVELSNEATVRVWVGGERIAAVGEGNGPVNALDEALRKGLTEHLPDLANISLRDFKVRVLDGSEATGSIVRVLIDSSDGHGSWTTIGVSPNVIDASWSALIDSIVVGLLRARVRDGGSGA